MSTQQKGHEKQVATEAGQPLRAHESKKCPHCGETVPGASDICESCGKWQLDDRCCFCYTPTPAGQKFCKKCGNPPSGIDCSSCGTHSIFDFCPNCDKPLSKGTPKYLETLAQSDEFLKLKALIAEPSSPDTGQSPTDVQSQLEQLNRYMKQFDEQPNAPSTAGFRFDSQNTDMSARMDEAGHARDSVNKYSGRVEDVELLNSIAQMQQKVFADNQAARKFYIAIKLLLPELKLVTNRRIVGWLCNFAGVLHIAGPTSCGGPGQGGRWIYENDTILTTVHIEK